MFLYFLYIKYARGAYDCKSQRVAPERRRIPVDQLPSRPGVLIDPESLDQFSPSDWNP